MKKIICLILLATLLCLPACSEVISHNNTLVSGALHAELYMGDEVYDNCDPPFADILWEPGMLGIESFTVKNEGELALNYKFELETESVSPTFANCLRVAVVENYSENMTRDQAEALFDDLDATPAVSAFSVSDVLDVGESDRFTVILYFALELAENVTQEEVKDAKFSAKILVTQFDYESDSFDNAYDQNALYSE